MDPRRWASWTDGPSWEARPPWVPPRGRDGVASQRRTFESSATELAKQLQSLQKQFDQENLTNQMYTHMRERLSDDKLQLDKRLERLQDLQRDTQRKYEHLLAATMRGRAARDQYEKDRLELDANIAHRRKVRERKLEAAHRRLDARHLFSHHHVQIHPALVVFLDSFLHLRC